MKEYPYRKMNEMREILEVLQMPSKLKNTRTILTLLAVARVKEKSKWSQVEESYARTHDMIVFMNEYYPNKGMAYYYKITTLYTDYETEREIESNPVYTGGIVNPLEIPTITEAKAGNNHSVTIMWNKTEDCLGYAIYRSESVDGEYKWISNVENKSEIFWWQEYESQATFTEKNLELGKTYYYKIRPYRKIRSDFFCKRLTIYIYVTVPALSCL